MRALILISLLLPTSASLSGRLFIFANDSNLAATVNALRGGRSRESPTVLPVRSAPGKESSAVTAGLKNTLASGLAAACSKSLLAPLDTIKTVQQHVEGGKSLGFFEAGRRITGRPGGVSNLYAGLSVAALGSMPSVGLYFGVYSYCKELIGPRLKGCLGTGRIHDGKDPLFSDGTLQTLTIICSAAIGNTIASFSRVPYEVTKQHLQTGKYPSTTQAIQAMWKEAGIRSFFPLGGVSSQMIRDIPYAIFTLLSYEYIKEKWVLKKSAEDPNNRWLRDMIAGGAAGGIGTYLTNPLDVIKTRLQTRGSSLYGGSIVTCAMAVLDEGGHRAFLRGSVPRLMQKIPANGCFFVFYEFFRRILRVKESSKF